MRAKGKNISLNARVFKLAKNFFTKSIATKNNLFNAESRTLRTDGTTLAHFLNETVFEIRDIIVYFIKCLRIR